MALNVLAGKLGMALGKKVAGWFVPKGGASRIYSGGSAFGRGISIAEAEAAAARHGIDTRMIQLQHEASDFGMGFVSENGAGNLIRAANGRFELTLTNNGLSSVKAAVETISHELNHIRGWLKTGTVSSEAAAEAAARSARPFIR